MQCFCKRRGNQKGTVSSLFDPCINLRLGIRPILSPIHQINYIMEKDKVVNEEVHRIRITLTSTNVKAVEKGRFCIACEC